MDHPVCGFRVRGGVFYHVDKGFAQGGDGVGGVAAAAAPHRALGEGLHGEGGYDAEVVAATTESPVEVGVGHLRYREDPAGGSDQLVGGYVITGEATDVRVVRDTTAQGEAAYTDACSAATYHSEVELLQVRVDIVPTIAGPDGSEVVGEDFDAVQALQRNGDAALDAGGPDEGSMATTFDCEGTLGEAREEDQRRHLEGYSRLKGAGRHDGILLGRPVDEGIGREKLVSAIDGLQSRACQGAGDGAFGGEVAGHNSVVELFI